MRTLGLNALIREALAAWSTDELSRTLRLAGGIPIGAPVLSPTQAYALRPSVPSMVPALVTPDLGRRTTVSSIPTTASNETGNALSPGPSGRRGSATSLESSSPGAQSQPSSGTSTPVSGGRTQRRRSTSAASMTRATSFATWGSDEHMQPFTQLNRAWARARRRQHFRFRATDAHPSARFGSIARHQRPSQLRCSWTAPTTTKFRATCALSYPWSRIRLVDSPRSRFVSVVCRSRP